MSHLRLLISIWRGLIVIIIQLSSLELLAQEFRKNFRNFRLNLAWVHYGVVVSVMLSHEYLINPTSRSTTISLIVIYVVFLLFQFSETVLQNALIPGGFEFTAWTADSRNKIYKNDQHCLLMFPSQ
jgi:hypothetical protein